MSVTVRVPTTFRTLTGGAARVEVDGSDVRSVFDGLEQAHPGFRSRLLDAEGNMHRFANVFVDDEDIRYLSGLDTPVPDGAEVTIQPAVAGG
jgi:molybdopterin synthase sulfur carrier subunit